MADHEPSALSSSQEDLYSNIAETNPVNPPPDTASPNQDEGLYASVNRQRAADSGNTAKEAQHTNVRFTRASADYRPGNAEDTSAIYGNVKKHHSPID